MNRSLWVFTFLMFAVTSAPLSAQVTPLPVSTSAPSAAAQAPAPGDYLYNVVVRGLRDTDGHVVVTWAPLLTAMSETTFEFSSTYLIAGSAVPQFSYSRTYYASRVMLDASGLPAAFTTETRPDRGWRFYGSGKLNADGTMQLAGSRRGTFSTSTPTARWVTMNGLGFAGAFLLPYEFQAAQGAPLMLASTETGVTPYTCVQGGVDHPKDVAAADVAIHCTGGREDATIWYDPATLVPDKIEIPSERATLMRRP
jgi:hypothetical protein